LPGGVAPDTLPRVDARDRRGGQGRPGSAGAVATVLCALVASRAAGQPLCTPTGANLIVDGITCQLGGIHTYGNVQVRNGGTIQVTAYNGADKVGTGNLELRADSITVDATSTITAVGRGYQTALCGSGTGPTATAGGPGGCKVSDSGGGGAHFGRGGRGTKDCNSGACGSDPSVCELPGEFEEACGSDLNGTGTACTSTGNCWDCDALPTNAGQAFWHSIYQPELGASGGDKGCFDGDGFFGQPDVGGPGGGRIVLTALTGAGTVSIQGLVIADGRRGCGTGNDSGGGGAGGTLFIVAEDVTVGPGAVITATGGLGGDTQPDGSGVCAFAQQNGTCDDCGGGGGGGIVSVLSVTASISDDAVFNVDGARGGVCAICSGEAGGGVGELQISGAFVGEVCDGFDNDFDGATDEGLPALPCGGPSCVAGQPRICPATPGCVGPVTDTRARFLVILDSSGSMLTDLLGRYTFGDGSSDHPGLDTDGNGAPDDSRLFRAKQALSTVIAAYPEIDFALGRYHQDQALDRSCQLAHWFECHDICCTYDDPRNNGGPPPSPACTLTAAQVGSAAPLSVTKDSPGDECINYAGSCGPPRRGADVLAGFGSDINQYLMWLDGGETNFIDDETGGDYCDFGGGGDCEVRGTGPTPLSGSLLSAADYLEPIVGCDAAALGGCRTYAVILLTDGAESCQGDPVAAAAALLALGVETYVVGFSVLPAEEAELSAIAHGGSFSGARDAFLVGDENELANTLADIVSGSVVFETCNGLDDDCDGLTDEDFLGLGQPCCDPCAGTVVCNATLDGTECSGKGPCPETCNGIDDDCDGFTDEGLTCFEICNGIDDDGDGLTDELPLPDLGEPCGSDEGECSPGVICCAGGTLECCGAVGPAAEVCDCLDNNCNTVTDEGAGVPCYTGPLRECPDPQSGRCTGLCRPGSRACVTDNCPTPSLGPCLGQVGPRPEECNCLDDDCDGVTDDGATCPGGAPCVDCACAIACDPASEFPCPAGSLCDCACGGSPPCYCIGDPCLGVPCPPGQRCDPCTGSCVDLCAGVDCGALRCCAGDCCAPWQGCEDIPGGVATCVDTSCTSEEHPCDPDEVCVDHACVPDPCAAAVCADDEYCLDGECKKVCPACDPDEICVEGRCRPDPCATASCVGTDVVCCQGECIHDPCASLHCDPGLSCDECTGRCVEDACPRIDCPTGYRCRRNQCEPEARQISTVSATGAGGCACATGGAGTPPIWLLLLALGLLRRPRALLMLLFLAGCQARSLHFAADAGGTVAPDAAREAAFCSPIPEFCNGLDDDCDGVADNGDPGGGTACGIEEGACRTGTTHCVAGQVVCQGDVRPEAELCDGLDNDCDGETDEVFDLCEPTSCGACTGSGDDGGTGPCAIGHAIVYCDASACGGPGCAGCAVCRVDFCEPGWIDCQLDAPPDDCDCTCRVPPRSEVCDGVDDDCNGETDEGVTTANFCRKLGACAGAVPVCMGTKGWCCDYGPDVETVPAANPCGFVVASEETLCDGADGDCDGLIDDPFVGQCDNGLFGACRDGGVLACDPTDPTRTICDLSQPPDPIGGPSPEVCNGIDDDCNGATDDEVIDDMVHITSSGNDFWIYRYEASRPDASSVAAGSDGDRACANPLVLPWHGVTFPAASAACAAAGKRLCTADEYLAACAGAAGHVYPYGDAFDPNACNAEPFDGIPGGTDDDVLLATGAAALSSCTSDDLVHDLSGNVKEWTDDITGQTDDGVAIAVLRGGAYDTPAAGTTCAFRSSRAPVTTVLPTVGFRCCSSTPP
jgi:MYXO-CTERM domain-containing protein